MLTRSLLFRLAGPSLLVSLLLLGMCVAAAVYQQVQQRASLRGLHESLRSRWAAAELLFTLEELRQVGGDPGEEQARVVRQRLAQVERFANQTDEKQLAGKIAETLAQVTASGAESRRSGDQASWETALQTVAIPLCRALERFNSQEVERAERNLRGTVNATTWGLIALGLTGAAVGSALGFLGARGLGRTVLRAESLAEVGQVAAGLAHELRNPLTAIKMLVQVNREDADAQGLPVEDLRVIEHEIRRMEDRLNVFIDFARPPRPDRRAIDLTQVVDQTVALVSGRARKQRVELSYRPPTSPLVVEADPEQIRQLLVNLALNALDVMPRGGVLEIDARPGPDNHAEITVLDTGPGIPTRHMPRLYEPFFTTKETGLGLGLPVSQRIAFDHGGTLQASNRPQGGARFLLRLPTRGPLAV